MADTVVAKPKEETREEMTKRRIAEREANAKVGTK